MFNTRVIWSTRSRILLVPCYYFVLKVITWRLQSGKSWWWSQSYDQWFQKNSIQICKEIFRQSPSWSYLCQIRFSLELLRLVQRKKLQTPAPLKTFFVVEWQLRLITLKKRLGFYWHNPNHRRPYYWVQKRRLTRWKVLSSKQYWLKKTIFDVSGWGLTENISESWIAHQQRLSPDSMPWRRCTHSTVVISLGRLFFSRLESTFWQLIENLVTD